MRAGDVYFQNRYAGCLVEQDNRTFSFRYDPDYLVTGIAIAYRLPLQIEAFVYPSLPPVFQNLIGEGWLRDTQATAQHIDREDEFGLLLANGGDLIGAITVTPTLTTDYPKGGQ